VAGDIKKDNQGIGFYPLNFNGLLNQQIRPIAEVVKRRIIYKTEKLIVFSGEILIKEKRNKRVASLVPSPKIEIGIKVAKVAILTDITK